MENYYFSFEQTKGNLKNKRQKRNRQFCGLTCFPTLKTVQTVAVVQNTVATVQNIFSYIIAVIYFSIGTTCIPFPEYDVTADTESLAPFQVLKR